MSDMLPGVRAITGTGAATATATLAANPDQKGYCIAASVEVTAGTATICRLELRGGGTPVFAQTFPVPAAATSTGGAITFAYLLPITAQNSALTIVATTTGATTTNVYGMVAYGP